MLKQAKDKIAIFFNEKSEARKYGKELRAEENKAHDLMIEEAKHLASRTSYGKIAKTSSNKQIELIERMV